MRKSRIYDDKMNGENKNNDSSDNNKNEHDLLKINMKLKNELYNDNDSIHSIINS